MDTERVDQLIEQADHLLAAAQQELIRAAEDVTAHLVCINARQAIVHYLSAFLLQNGSRPAASASMEGLLAQCQALDARFDLISLDDIHCRTDTDHQAYCLTVEQVDGCLNVAGRIREIVGAVAPGY